MATNLTVTEVSSAIAWNYNKTDDIGGTTTNSNRVSWGLTTPITQGTGANAAQVLYFATRSIAATANDDLDLAGSLTDAFGATVTFAKIKGIFISHNTTTASSSITVGGGGSNPVTAFWAGTTPGVKLRNGYHFMLAGTDATGYVVTGGSADVLRITNADGSLAAYYTIVIYGE